MLTLLKQIRGWWQSWYGQVQDKLLALLELTPTQTQASIPAPTLAATEAAEGNAALNIVAHFELEGQGIVLLQNTGNTACPALYRFATLTLHGIMDDTGVRHLQ